MYTPRLADGTPLDEAASSLQKAIRRGLEETAFFWAKSLCESGFHAYTWKRLATIVSEDVGDPMATVLVSSLWTSWRAIWEQQGKKALPDLDLLAQAVLCLCRAPKSREADEFKNLVEERMETGWKPLTPHYALDLHTFRGRNVRGALGRSRRSMAQSWWDEATKIHNAAGESAYHARLKAYGGDSHAGVVAELVHSVDKPRPCASCGFGAEAVCAECGQVLCYGCLVACGGLCGAYWCREHAPEQHCGRDVYAGERQLELVAPVPEGEQGRLA